jgi:hypothetical protein
MIEDAALAASTGAAGNIVAYMLNGRVDALRNHVVRIFRHGSDVERSHALQTLERDAVALVENDATRDSLMNQWRDLLLSYLIAHPEAREEIESFASLNAASTTKIKSMKHTGTGPQIVGPNFGNMTFKK